MYVVCVPFPVHSRAHRPVLAQLGNPELGRLKGDSQVRVVYILHVSNQPQTVRLHLPQILLQLRASVGTGG